MPRAGTRCLCRLTLTKEILKTSISVDTVCLPAVVKPKQGAAILRKQPRQGHGTPGILLLAHCRFVLRLQPAPPLFSITPSAFCAITFEVHGRVSLWAYVGAHVCAQHAEVSRYNGNVNYTVSNSWSSGVGRVSSLRDFAKELPVKLN